MCVCVCVCVCVRARSLACWYASSLSTMFRKLWLIDIRIIMLPTVNTFFFMMPSSSVLYQREGAVKSGFLSPGVGRGSSGSPLHFNLASVNAFSDSKIK